MRKIILFVLMVTLLCGCQNQQEIESVDEVTQTTESIIEVHYVINYYNYTLSYNKIIVKKKIVYTIFILLLNWW